MKITAVSATNYRTLARLDLTFPSSYTAICGPNDSGKTNVVRAIRCLMKEEEKSFRFHDDVDQISFKNDFPKWKTAVEGDRNIRIAVDLLLDKDRDAGFYHFINRQLQLKNEPQTLELRIIILHSDDK